MLRLKQLTRRVYEYYRSPGSMIVYKSRRFAVRRYQYGGSGIVGTIGSLLVRYAPKAMLATAAKAPLKGSLKAAKRAIPHLIAHKVVSTIADAAKKQKSRYKREIQSRASVKQSFCGYRT